MNQVKLQALLDKQFDKGKITSTVVRVQSKDGSLDLAAAAGIADVQANTPMTVDTPYFLASITKMYTATAIINLHEQGRIDLDEVLSKYLPASLIDGIHVYKGVAYSSQIKVYQLLNQTTGLADYFEGKPKNGRSVFDDLKQGKDRALNVSVMMQIVRSLTPYFEPGKKANYSDTNFQLLGAIVEAVSGKSLAEVFEEMIFSPLGLEHTYLFDVAQAQSEILPAPFYFKNQLIDTPQFMTASGPDGGIVFDGGRKYAFPARVFRGQAVRFEELRQNDGTMEPRILSDAIWLWHDAR